MINIDIREGETFKNGDACFVSTPYDPEVVGALRALPMRNYNSADKIWECPVKYLSNLITAFGGKPVKITGLVAPQKEVSLDFSYKTTPYSYQADGVQYGLKNGSFILGDEQGLGKTKQIIDLAVALKERGEIKHCLIICGINNLKYNWEKEIKIHSNEQAIILGSRRNKKGKYSVSGNADKMEDLEALKRGLLPHLFIVTNVETLRYTKLVDEKEINPATDLILEMVEQRVIGLIAIDEVHKCKNPSSQQGKQLLRLRKAEKSKHRIIPMSGTPILNSPLDAYVPLRLIGEETHNYGQFKRFYINYGGYGGYEVMGYKNMDRLQSIIEGCMLRRLKSEVLDLPPKIRIVESLEMGAAQEKIYNEADGDIRKNIDKIRLSNNPLAELIRLRQATGYTGILSTKVQESVKYERMLDIAEEAVGNGKKVIVFSNWTQVVNPAYALLKENGYAPAIYTGEYNDEKCFEEKERFMTDPACKVIIGTIAKMGTGLTLTAATVEIFLDEPWNAGTKEQAEDRAHRIGTSEPLTIYTLLCKDTADERINDLVNAKGMMADMLVDGKPVDMNAVLDYILG